MKDIKRIKIVLFLLDNFVSKYCLFLCMEHGVKSNMNNKRKQCVLLIQKYSIENKTLTITAKETKHSKAVLQWYPPTTILIGI